MCAQMKTRLAWVMAAAALLTGCYPPPVSYPYTKLVTERRSTLQTNLLALLPESQRTLPDAGEEARWLSDTAYKAAAGISRVNDSNFPGWAGNALINARMQDRGLCWQYQHDMFRELRRRPLKYFRIGCCVRDLAEPSEHNCVYVCAINGKWPDGWILDAWMWNGRLKVSRASEEDQDRWQDLPDVCSARQKIYPEGHTYPIEHWSVIHTDNNGYAMFWEKAAQNSRQYKRMLENIERGKKEHPGSPTNY